MQAKLLIALMAGVGLLLLPFSSAGQTTSRSSDRQQTRPQVSGGRSTDVRKLRKPPDPEAVALLIHLLDRYASEVPDKSELDKRVEQRLAQNGITRESARRMMSNFRKISLADRRAVLGQWADIPARERIPESRYRTAFARAARAAGPARRALTTDSHAVNPSARQSPKQLRPARKPQPRGWLTPPSTPNLFPAGFRQLSEPWDLEIGNIRRISYSPLLAFQEPLFPRYGLWYEGIWCHHETYADNFNDYDQIYIVTTVADAHGNITTKMHPRPSDTHFYDDVNTDDHRTGPRRRASGDGLGPRGRYISGLPAQDITLTVAVFEFDAGPEELDEAMEVLGGISTTVAAFCLPIMLVLGPAPCLAAGAGALIAITYLVVTGGHDDLISVETAALSSSEIQTMANEEPRLKLHEIPYHFSTIHNGGPATGSMDGPAGADYHVYFTVRELPPPPVGQPGS